MVPHSRHCTCAHQRVIYSLVVYECVSTSAYWFKTPTWSPERDQFGLDVAGNQWKSWWCDISMVMSFYDWPNTFIDSQLKFSLRRDVEFSIYFSYKQSANTVLIMYNTLFMFSISLQYTIQYAYVYNELCTSCILIWNGLVPNMYQPTYIVFYLR